MNVRGIDRNKIVLFLDNCPCHSSHYALWNLYNQSIKVVYNVPNTPAYNIIETLFGDLKKYVRNKKITSSSEYVKHKKQGKLPLDMPHSVRVYSKNKKWVISQHRLFSCQTADL